MKLKTTVNFGTPYGSYPHRSLEIQRYPNGDIRLQLYNLDGPVATGTAELPQRLGTDEIAIKDYGESQGMLSALIESGLDELPHRCIENGYVTIPICRSKGELLEVIQQIEPGKPAGNPSPAKGGARRKRERPMDKAATRKMRGIFLGKPRHQAQPSRGVELDR